MEPLIAYRVPGEPEKPEGDLRETHEDERDRHARKVLRCDRCELEITDEDHRIAVNGRHEHDCVNPGGYDYHIGCFAAAPGCHPVGIPAGYWSWFPGYMWQNDNCARCGRHLGWRFHCADDVFHGLILARLV